MTDKISPGRQAMSEEPATVPGPASYEEELKDYSHTCNESQADHLPENHPAPAPTKDSP